MIGSYNNIKLSTGRYTAGLYKIKIAPREWLQFAIEKEFNSGKVIDEVLLENGQAFIELEFIPDSYYYEEKPKSNKSGSYFETEAGGIVNDISPETLLSLETLRYHEFVVILYDRRHRLKVVGTKEKGMRLQLGNKEDANNGGNQVLSIALSMENECLTPFYEV